MTLPPTPRPGICRRSVICVPALLLTLVGCRKPEIRAYTAPKDAEERQQPVNSELVTELPKLTWTLPPGWKDLGPDQMSAARFTTAGDASVMVTPLANMAGQEASLVNMWRQMMEQPILDPDGAAKTLSPVDLAGEKGSMFEVTGKRGPDEMKIVTAFVHRADKSWFFKLQGTPAAVDAQKAAYMEFLKSVKFEAPTASPAPAPAAPAPAPAAPAPTPAPAAPAAGVPGTPPAEWAVQPPGPMQAAKFAVTGKDAAKADVTVSIFPSDTGGAVSNVTRWRGQIGLPAADEAAIRDSIKPLPGGPEGSVIVDLENNGRSLTGAIVPRAGSWYFYKLMGDTAAVTAARDTFITYCKAGS